ncbi:hypothetical protein Trydic_g2092 [Trypoxylus dichotomus]
MSGILAQLMNGRSMFDPALKILLSKIVLEPMVTYAKSLGKKLQTFQNRMLQWALDAHLVRKEHHPAPKHRSRTSHRLHPDHCNPPLWQSHGPSKPPCRAIRSQDSLAILLFHLTRRRPPGLIFLTIAEHTHNLRFVILYGNLIPSSTTFPFRRRKFVRPEGGSSIGTTIGTSFCNVRDRKPSDTTEPDHRCDYDKRP